ncbi:MAG: MarC family protein [Phycisphaerales bacterium]
MRAELVQAIVTLVAIMNPVGTAPIFQNMVSPLPTHRQRVAGVWACVFIFGILAGAAFVGQHVLNVFGISIDAFRAAGGIVLGLMGLNMLQGRKSEEHERLADEKEIRENLLVPFAMPLVAGPGSITAVIVLAAPPDQSSLIPWAALAAVAAGTLATGLCLFLMLTFGRFISQDAQRIFTRFMGLILVAMGMQFLLAGSSGVMQPVLMRQLPSVQEEAPAAEETVPAAPTEG